MPNESISVSLQLRRLHAIRKGEICSALPGLESADLPWNTVTIGGVKLGHLPVIFTVRRILVKTITLIKN